MRPIHLVCALLVFDFTLSMKVRDRLLKYKTGEPKCTVSMFRPIGEDDLPHEIWRSFLKTVNYVARDLNCSVLLDEQSLHTKIPGPNETYDGYVGTIHRNEADYGIFGVRADSLPGEPGKPTPPFTSGDIIIISARYPPEVLNYDLTKFLDLGIVNYSFMMIAIFFMFPFILVYAEAVMTIRAIHRKVVLLIERYFKQCENVINLLMDQENFEVRSVAGQILVLSVCIFTMIAVRGYILNSVGADLVTIRSEPPIDTLDELMTSKTIPLIVNNLFAYHAFKSSPEGSRNHQLWLRIQKEMPKSLLIAESSAKVVTGLERVIGQIWNHQVAFLEIEPMAHMLKTISCGSDFVGRFGNKSTGLHLSQEHLAHGMMTGLFSHRIHPYTEKVIRTGLMTFFEAALYDGLVKIMPYILPAARPELGLKVDSKVLSCMSGLKNKEDLVPGALDVPRMRHFLFAWQYIWCLAFIMLAFEIFWNRLMRRCRKKSINRVQPLPVVTYHRPSRYQRQWLIPRRY